MTIDVAVERSRSDWLPTDCNLRVGCLLTVCRSAQLQDAQRHCDICAAHAEFFIGALPCRLAGEVLSRDVIPTTERQRIAHAGVEIRWADLAGRKRWVVPFLLCEQEGRQPVTGCPGHA